MNDNNNNQNNHNNNTQNIILIVIGILLLVIGTAAASVYFARSSETPKTEEPKVAIIAPAPAPSAPARHVVREERVETRRVATTKCDDGNIVGKAVGGVGAGALASNIGKGKGQTAATIAGTLGGAYLGGEYIPTKDVTCR